MSAYGKAALDREHATLSRLTEGRYGALCHAAFVIGQLVGADAIGRAEAESALFAAAHAMATSRNAARRARGRRFRPGLISGQRSRAA
jgi:hypothetical protein